MQTLSSCRIGNCEIKNRFVMTAANLGWCEDGCITKKVIRFYQERAKGGTGLIIAGAAGIDPIRVNDTGMMQIYDNRFVAPFSELTREIHKEGSKIFLQLMHAGAYAKQCEHGGKKAVGPSAYFCNFTREEPEELSETEIRQITIWFGEAAARAKKAGFDGVELIGSAGYLIAEFLSSGTNQRTDAYGGDLKSRTRFLRETITSVREYVGEDYPVVVRLSGTDFIPGGNGPKEVVQIAKSIANQVDAIDITGGWHESRVPQITYNVPHGMYLYLAKAVKEAVDIPVIGCNRMNPERAEYAIKNGCADMVGMLRELIADPYLVRKYAEGKEREIRPCLACNQECLEPIFSGGGIGCVVNPAIGREEFYEKKSRSFHSSTDGKKKKSVLVIGAGIAGMVCASLVSKFADVTVCEKGFCYGGAANAVARLPGREDAGDYIGYLFRKCILGGVNFKWNAEAEPERIRQALDAGIFDNVVIATGADCDCPEFAVDGSVPVFYAQETIMSDAPKGRKIVVIGSGYKAVQTAQYLASANKNGDRERKFLKRHAPEYADLAADIMEWRKPEVTILASAKRVGGGFGKSIRFMMMSEIKEQGIKVETEAHVREIRAGKVIWLSGAVQERKETPVDMVVIAEGWRQSENRLITELKSESRVLVLGDAKRPGRISEAVKDAYEVALILKENDDVSVY